MADDNYFTVERIQNTLDHHLAASISQTLYENGLISCEEYAVLNAINRKSFPPLFSELLPETT